MNLIILVEKKNPKGQPLVLVTPDTLDGNVLESVLPQKYIDKFIIHTVSSDQPTVVTELLPIIKLLAEGDD